MNDVFADLGVSLPTWGLVTVLLLPALDFLHSLTPWSQRLWRDDDHRGWQQFWGTIVGIRWTQAGLAAVAFLAANGTPSAVGVVLPSIPVTVGSLGVATAFTAWYWYEATTTPAVPVADAPTDFTTTYPANRRERVLWFVSGGLSASVCEEVVYRGVTLAALLGAGLPWPVAVLAAALAFAATHGLAILNPMALAFYVGFALVMTGLVGLTGSLLPAVVLHLVNNLWQAINAFREEDPATDADTVAA